jgi:type IV pilus assembly protein PilM
MGNHVIGLDVGTHAVRAVELSFGRGRPLLQKMAQVTLPRGAVVAGEVTDIPAVSSALRRLWREGGFTGKEVVVGVANARVVARVAELPKMPLDELRTSLPFQVQDLIPIPAEDAQLDFQVIDEHVVAPELEDAPEGGSTEPVEEKLRVLLVAAHRDMLRSLMAALEGAGLKARRVDLIPFALIRALGGAGSWSEEGGPEVIVASGAGVTNVVVHEDGIARFARTLPVGGGNVTDALAEEMGIEADAAESMKRATPDHESASTAIVPLVSEVAGSLDFHLAQTTGSELSRVVLSGGGARLVAFRRVLEDQLGVPVVDGDPFAQLDVSKVNVDPDEAARARDLFTVAIGLALGGTSGGVSLLPSEVAAKRAERKQNMLAAAGVGGFATLLVGLSVMRGGQVDSARRSAEEAEQRTTRLTAEVAALSDIDKLQADIATGKLAVAGALHNEIVWPDVIRDVAAVIPDDVWLVSFAGSPGVSGQPPKIQVSAKGAEQTSTARWLLRVSDLPGAQNVWLSNSAKRPATDGVRPVVEFSSTAELTVPAASPRLERYTGEEAK